MHTGDLATMDGEGYVNSVGRIKDMIIRGGENVYPREVEEWLFSHPAVADVAVIGVPDEKFGEGVKAIVVLRDGQAATEGDLIEFCRGEIAHFKCPKSIEFGELPKTSTGKVQKFKLREKEWAGMEKKVN